jgi:hypothetical protein
MQRRPDKDAFRRWAAFRYSSDTNAAARRLQNMAFGQQDRQRIDEATYSLSLSDCYWIRSEADAASFEEVSPYYADFWKGGSAYPGGAVPTLYTTGALGKEWVSRDWLHKYGKETRIELECYGLCRACGIEHPSASVIDGGISVRNFTSPDVMFEPAGASGAYDPDYASEREIIRGFGIPGVQMLAIDAIVGNGDRHPGNFGFMRDTNDGRHVGMSPVFDFDHALDSRRPLDRITTDLAHALRELSMDGRPEYGREALRIARRVLSLDARDVFKEKAAGLISALGQEA